MPGRKYITLLAMFAASLVLLGIAWSSGSRSVCLPRPGQSSFPASFVFIIIAAAAIITSRSLKTGLMVCSVVAAGMAWGTLIAASVAYVATARRAPDILDLLIIVALGATSIYGWAVREYLED